MITRALLGASAGFAVLGCSAWIAPAAIRRANVTARRLVAVLAGVAAIPSGLEFTGVGTVDGLLAAVMVGIVVVSATHARARVVSLAAVACAGVAYFSPDPLWSFAAAGAGIAMRATVRRSPLLAAVVAGVMVNAAIRLDIDAPYALPTIAIIATIAPIAVSGHRRLRPATRRRCDRAALTLASLVALVGCLGVAAMASARISLTQGVADAERAVVSARSGDSVAAESSFAAAAAKLAAARTRLTAAWSTPALFVPVVGPHLRALATVADTGADLAGTGKDLVSLAALDRIELANGRLPLDELERLAKPLRVAETAIRSARLRLHNVGKNALVPPVRRRLDTYAIRLADISDMVSSVGEVVSVVPSMLGADQPRRWFLAIQTPSESRGSGGFMGSFGEILLDRGRFELARFGRINELNGNQTASQRTLEGPADYLRRYRRFAVETTWQNVNFSPDFPSVGNVISRLYPQSGGSAVDGVVSIDPAGLAALLRLTGPIRVENWPSEISAENAEEILLHAQYLALANEERIDFLGAVAQSVLGRLTTGALGSARQVVDTLGAAVATKHIQITAASESEESLLRRIGANGAMAPVRGDSLAVVTQNAGGNKIDWFLRRTADYIYRVDRSTGQLDAKLTLTIDNLAPPAGLPDYVIGSPAGSSQARGTNRLYLSVYTPWNVRNASLNGVPTALESEQELGRNVYSMYVDIPAESRAVIQIALRGQLLRSKTYRLDLHAQPLVEPDTIRVGTAGAAARVLRLDRDRTYEAPLP